MEIFEFPKEDIINIFYCLLNRINILVIGETIEEIQNGISQISILISFRKEIILGNNIVTAESFFELISSEKENPEGIKHLFLCPPTALENFTNIFCLALGYKQQNVKPKKDLIPSKDDIKSWIIGISSEKYSKEVREKLDFILTDKYLEISFTQKKVQTKGITFTQKDVSFERKTYDLINQYDSKSHYVKMQDEVEKLVKAAIDTNKLIGLNEFLQDFIKTSLEQIRNQVINDEFQNFATAGKKIFMVLSKLKELFIFSKAYIPANQTKYLETINEKIAIDSLIVNATINQKYLFYITILVDKTLEELQKEPLIASGDKMIGEFQEKYKLPRISEGTLNKISGYKSITSFKRMSEFIEGEYGMNLTGFVGGKEAVDALSNLF